jgi:hypothetical protein
MIRIRLMNRVPAMAASLALLTPVVAAGCGGEPEQTVDVTGLIEVDDWNEETGVTREEFEAAVAETLQERAPSNVKVIYNETDGSE